MVARQISFQNVEKNNLPVNKCRKGKLWKKSDLTIQVFVKKEKEKKAVFLYTVHRFASQSVYAGAFAWRPPSTKSSSPVIEDDWSEARKSITLATSSGSMAPVNGCSSVCLSKYWKTVYTYMYYECLSTAKHVWIYVHPVKHYLKNKTKEQKKKT